MFNPFVNSDITDVAAFATSAGTSVAIAAGQLNTATNGERKWGSAIPWSANPSAVVTAYAAGAYRKVRVSFAAAALTPNKENSIRIRENVPFGVPADSVPANPVNLLVGFASGSATPTAINWATLCAAALSEYSANSPELYLVAYTPGNNYVDVTCYFGTAGVLLNTWTITCPTDAAVTFTDQTALAQPIGTVAQVNRLTGGGGIVGTTYDMYQVYYDQKTSVPNGQGVNGNVRDQKIIFVDTAGGVTGGGAFDTEFDAIFAGTETASKYLSRPITG